MNKYTLYLFTKRYPFIDNDFTCYFYKYFMVPFYLSTRIYSMEPFVLIIIE